MKKDTHVKTRIVQFDVMPGRPRINTDRMLKAIRDARTDGVALLVFPEMAIPGYLLGDLWEQQAFLRQCEACGEEIRKASDGLTVVFGNVAMDWLKRNEDGRVRKYNALFVADHGRFIGPEQSPYPFCIKALMPNYRQFDDSRHFFDLRKLAFERDEAIDHFLTPVNASCAVLGCILCEDAWDPDYALSPLGRLSQHQDIELFINASASPFTFNKNHKRNRVFSAHARQLRRPLIYVNHTGIQNNGKTVFTFDGASCVYDAHGHAVRCPSAFDSQVLTLDIPRAPDTAFAPPETPHHDGVDDLCDALCYGISRFLSSCGIHKVVIGASGGIDSAVVAALFRLVLPPENLLLVNMPSRYNSATTRDLAADLAQRLDVPYVSIPIEDSVALTHRQIDGLRLTCPSLPAGLTLRLSDFMLENVQARDRSSRILAALAAAFVGGFTCNANKSELTVGYSTLYGDLGGFLAPIGDLWKGDVYALARHLNATTYGREVIPEGSITVVPSAELSPQQDVDKGLGDPLIYPYHDRLFESWVEWWNRATPEDILEWYIAGELEQRLHLPMPIKDIFPEAKAFIADLERWWNQYQGIGLAKRIQAPPVLAVKRRAFGFDHRESQMGAGYTDSYLNLKAKLLN
ncbi:MAG TPA: NAD(+) synthase [Verrucomicrobia bacterium]|nr:NAD(+) synthase [Verrucomicrobiota bacterium]